MGVVGQSLAATVVLLDSEFELQPTATRHVMSPPISAVPKALLRMLLGPLLLLLGLKLASVFITGMIIILVTQSKWLASN